MWYYNWGEGYHESVPFFEAVIELKSLGTEDFPTQEGSAIYTGSQPGVDSAVVGICRAAGAIILGKTVSRLLKTALIR
jgi:Asp-tRNA(Asn)/Glu-tRNA(Gln) amidotransferase A subunit family amidase